MAVSDQPRRAGRPEVALVSMPFGPLLWPSIGLSLLKGALLHAGIRAEVHYLTLRLAHRIGERLYSSLADGRRPANTLLAGEWVFSADLFGTGAAPGKPYLDRFLRAAPPATKGSLRPLPERLVSAIERLRDRVPSFLDESARRVLERRPRVVGFSSVFQQHVASLALARRLKELDPALLVVVGGANAEGPMGAETLRQFTFLDAVVSGEGEEAFPELVRRHLAGEEIRGVPGVRTRAELDADDRTFASAPPIRELDGLPEPDYRDYFLQFRRTRLRDSFAPGVFLETSRGCWWGERMHCTFCGLNGATMTYRSKSPSRALAELDRLGRRHPGASIAVVDNILDHAYFRELVPALAARARKPDLFYETKSNLKKEQVRALRDAGIGTIQPGIESLSDRVLALMRKGVTGLQNVQLLKWCRELGVAPLWNFLWGFPGEPREEYARMAAVVPLLAHLPPPVAEGSLRLDRFSPNFERASELGIANVRPVEAYAHVYPVDPGARARLAYFFAFDPADGSDARTYTEPLRRRLVAWRRHAARSSLFALAMGARDEGAEEAEEGRAGTIVCDLRPRARRPILWLTGEAHRILGACDAVRPMATIAEGARDASEFERALGELAAAGLVLRDGGRVLSLALPVGEWRPGAEAHRRFAALLAAHATREAAGLRIALDPLGAARRRHRGSGAPALRDLARVCLDASRYAIGRDGGLFLPVERGCS